MNWIDIEIQKPDVYGYYLVAYTESYQHVAPAYYCDVDYCFKHIRTFNKFETVKFWAKLPEPPKNKFGK